MKTIAALLVTGILIGNAGVAAAQPAAQPAAQLGKPAAASPAGKYDTKLPIEISSDTLEVLQHDSKAIFRGNVIAVQGQIRLKSDVMTVHYKQKNDAGKTSPPPKPPEPKRGDTQSSGPMGAITKIDVEGNVFMATPEESAKGDTGNYDVDTKMVHLFGNNVTLTRDKNILRGTALEYNLDTGRSLLTNEGGRVHERVRGVFVPNQEPQKPAQDKK